jgi:hypothetical protein
VVCGGEKPSYDRDAAAAQASAGVVSTFDQQAVDAQLGCDLRVVRRVADEQNGVALAAQPLQPVGALPRLATGVVIAAADQGVEEAAQAEVLDRIVEPAVLGGR